LVAACRGCGFGGTGGPAITREFGHRRAVSRRAARRRAASSLVDDGLSGSYRTGLVLIAYISYGEQLLAKIKERGHPG